MENNNHYEELIDQMMIDEVSGLDTSIKATLEGLTDRQKRMAILSILDKDRDLYVKLRKIVDNNTVSKSQHIKTVVKMLRRYVEVGDVEKKKFGEVMTPISLVEDMLDKLPKEVWSNPELKWLDNCNGVGIFPCVVVERLMDGLSDWEKDEEKRYRHIMENMIYVAELQPKNMFLYLCGFDPYDEYVLNIYTGSFLDESFDNHMRDVWGVDKFDIIVGNPPYNDNQNAKGKRGGGSTLWDKFVIKSLNYTLKENGLLTYVHPTLWRKPQSERSSSREVSSLMMNKQIHYLEMHNSKDGMKIFNAGTRYDFYILENTLIYKRTIINGEDRKDISIDLSGYNFIPNSGLLLFNKLLQFNNIEKCYIVYNVSNYETRKCWVSDKEDDIFRYKLVHSTPKSSTRYKYSSRNDKGHFGISKVIFGEGGINDVIIDMKGEYGMTQGAMALKVESFEEAVNIRKALLSHKFSEFLKTVMWSNFQIDWRLFLYLKKDFWKEFI